MALTCVNWRMRTLRIKTKFLNLSIINVHAPTEDSVETEKEEFYSKLERTYDNVPSNEIKTINGDLTR
jgi:hypothetical protein